jgi:hypothetical protein
VSIGNPALRWLKKCTVKMNVAGAPSPWMRRATLKPAREGLPKRPGTREGPSLMIPSPEDGPVIELLQ